MPKRARLQPLPPAGLPQTLARLRCTCEPPPPRPRRGALQHCAACAAWDYGMVLLADGTQLAKAVWLQQQAPTEEEAHA